MIDSEVFRKQLLQVAVNDGQLQAITLEELVRKIPRIDQIDRPPSTSTVLVRTDLDLPLQSGEVVDTSRLESSEATIRYCLDRGWKVVLLGHISRDPRASLRPVCSAFSEILGTPIDFVSEWLDQKEARFQDQAARQIAEQPPGSVLMLENARKYGVERVLWTADPEEVQQRAEWLLHLATDIRNKVTDTEINESIAASNTDFSSSVVPLVMAKTGLGFFIDREMKERIPEVRRADFVVFSGLKMNKLDDLERMIEKRTLHRVLVAGALSMPLKGAQAKLAGANFSLGRAESDPSYRGFVEPGRFQQAERIIRFCHERQIDLVLPVDFILDNGEVHDEVSEGRVQMDVGPQSRTLFARKVEEYIQATKDGATIGTVFYNGVFGKFEEVRFEGGTREFISLLRTMTEQGVDTYVGGGEGRLALMKYGSLSDVTHAFTSGGTVLKCLADRHIGYLKAMYLQNAGA